MASKEIFIPLSAQDTKVLYVLETFTALDLNRFRKYLTSPYFNHQAHLVTLYDTLLPTLRGKQSQYPDKATLYRKLFKTKYLDVKLRRALSDLLALAEDYIGYEQYRLNHALRQADTLHATNARGITRLFEGNYALAQGALAREPHQDTDYHYHQYLLATERNQHLEHQKLRSDDKNLAPLLYHLDAYYFLSKLRHACAIEHYRNVLHLELQVLLIEPILAAVEQEPFCTVPAIAVYVSVYYMLRETDSEPHYQRLKTLLQTQAQYLAPATERDAYIFSINYCVKQINRGQLAYLREVFEVYNQALEKNYLFDRAELSPWDYKNLVTLGLRLKENTWTEKFIKEYRDKLPKANRSNAYTYNLAKFYFYLKRYDQVLHLLQDVKYDDIFYLLDSKTLLVKTYYEMSEYTALYSLISSFKALIRRKRKISDTHRKNYTNLLTYTASLSRANVRDKKTLQELRTAFDKTTQIADAGWLREKFEELGV